MPPPSARLSARHKPSRAAGSFERLLGVAGNDAHAQIGQDDNLEAGFRHRLHASQCASRKGTAATPSSSRFAMRRRASPLRAPRLRRCARPAETRRRRSHQGAFAPPRRCQRGIRCRQGSTAHSLHCRSRGAAVLSRLSDAPCGSSAGTTPVRGTRARGCYRSPPVLKRCRPPDSMPATDAARADASRGRCVGASEC